MEDAQVKREEAVLEGEGSAGERRADRGEEVSRTPIDI